jgi:hypothetical protein
MESLVNEASKELATKLSIDNITTFSVSPVAMATFNTCN